MENSMDTDTPIIPVTHKPLAPQPSSKKPLLIIAGIALIILCFVAGIGGSYLYNTLGNTGSASLTSSYDGNSIVSKQEQDVAAVADKVAPSVVSILTTSRSRTSSSYVQEQAGAGTGIIISKDGYILTNNHVVEGATTVSVVSAEGTTYDNVKVIGRDPLNDVAFLKISGASDLPAADLGDSKSVRIGQNVVAIGNALGQYQNTVTSGIISGTGRSVVASTDGTASGDAESLTDLIQTDAAINSGNSGGPLVNMAGQVIGINTAIASDANSVGFVIPISSTKGVIAGVLSTGQVSRAYLGVRYLSVTAEVAKEYKLSVKQGAYVFTDSGAAVVSGGPADKAGIREKDVITKVNGVEIGTKGSVATLVGEYKPGDTVELTLLREGKTITTKVDLTPYKS
jgi:serine protease Do